MPLRLLLVIHVSARCFFSPFLFDFPNEPGRIYFLCGQTPFVYFCYLILVKVFIEKADWTNSFANLYLPPTTCTITPCLDKVTWPATTYLRHRLRVCGRNFAAERPLVTSSNVFWARDLPLHLCFKYEEPAGPFFIPVPPIRPVSRTPKPQCIPFASQYLRNHLISSQNRWHLLSQKQLNSPSFHHWAYKILSAPFCQDYRAFLLFLENRIVPSVDIIWNILAFMFSASKATSAKYFIKDQCDWGQLWGH